MPSTGHALVVRAAPRNAHVTPHPPGTAQHAAQLRAHVWIEARHFFSRADAQQYCWLWLLGGDGRVHALRLGAERCGDDHAAKSLLARFSVDPGLPIPGAKRCGPAFPLPGAPVVPLPRWSVSWGHPVQQAIRAFAARLDADVLAALGALEVPGPFFGSVGNYNRLALLAPTVRAHRLQALAEFPPLIAPLLLDTFGRPDLFGTDEDEPEDRAGEAGEVAQVLDATDRGRDLVGALAGHYGIGRALVRSRLFREPWATGGVPHEVLRLLEAISPPARPRDRVSLEQRLPYLRALPLRMHNEAEASQLANAFAHGWDATWRTVEATFPALAIALRDTRDFLREVLADAAETMADTPPDMRSMALAWMARLGPLSLLEASRRWHAQPLIVAPISDGLPDAITPLFGEFICEWGNAVELTTRQTLIAEGNAMHHCIGTYWAACVTSGLRAVHFTLAGTGATATATLAHTNDEAGVRFGLQALRGPCNESCDPAAERLAECVLARLNAQAAEPLRRQVLAEAARAREAHNTHLAAERPRDRRPLDRRSRTDCRKVLAWWARRRGPTQHQHVLLRGPIAGFRHAEGPLLLRRLAPGDALQLVREPANPHDPHAVRIDWNGHKLGYVARADAADLAQQLDAGTALGAVIAAVDETREAWNPVEFEIARK